MEKAAVKISDCKSYGVPSGITIAAQRQQHAAERGMTNITIFAPLNKMRTEGHFYTSTKMFKASKMMMHFPVVRRIITLIADGIFIEIH